MELKKTEEVKRIWSQISFIFPIVIPVLQIRVNIIWIWIRLLDCADLDCRSSLDPNQQQFLYLLT